MIRKIKFSQSKGSDLFNNEFGSIFAISFFFVANRALFLVSWQV
jgi:hypothetical protein